MKINEKNPEGINRKYVVLTRKKTTKKHIENDEKKHIENDEKKKKLKTAKKTLQNDKRIALSTYPSTRNQ